MPEPRGGVTSGSGGRRHADDDPAPLLPDVSRGRRDPRGFALEQLSTCFAENLSSDGEGDSLAVIGHPEGTKKSLANAHAPARITGERSRARPNRSLRPPLFNVAAEMPQATGSKISLETRHDRIYEPYGVARRALPLVCTSLRRLVVARGSTGLQCCNPTSQGRRNSRAYTTANSSNGFGGAGSVRAWSGGFGSLSRPASRALAEPKLSRERDLEERRRSVGRVQ